MSQMAPEAAKKLLSTQTAVGTRIAARCIGTSEPALRDLVARGEAPIPHYFAGRRLRFPSAAIAALLHLDLSEVRG